MALLGFLLLYRAYLYFTTYLSFSSAAHKSIFFFNILILFSFFFLLIVNYFRYCFMAWQFSCLIFFSLYVSRLIFIEMLWKIIFINFEKLFCVLMNISIAQACCFYVPRVNIIEKIFLYKLMLAYLVKKWIY